MGRRRAAPKVSGKAKAKKEAQKREAAPRFATVGQLAEFYWQMVFRQDVWAMPALYFCGIQVRVKAGTPVYKWDGGEEVNPIALVEAGYHLWDQTHGLPWLGLYHVNGPDSWMESLGPSLGQDPAADPAGMPWKQPPNGYKGELWKLPTRRVVVEARVVGALHFKGCPYMPSWRVRISIRPGLWREPLFPPSRCNLERTDTEELKAWMGVVDGRVHLNLTFQQTFLAGGRLQRQHIVQTNPEDWDEYSDTSEEDLFDLWEREPSHYGDWERAELLIEEAAVANGEF